MFDGLPLSYYSLAAAEGFIKQNPGVSVDICLNTDSPDLVKVVTEKYPEVNNEGANDFIEWICSDEVQELIGEYGVEEYGQALFTPNAGTDA